MGAVIKGRTLVIESHPSHRHVFVDYLVLKYIILAAMHFDGGNPQNTLQGNSMLGNTRRRERFRVHQWRRICTVPVTPPPAR